jgi:hypothetical protein
VSRRVLLVAADITMSSESAHTMKADLMARLPWLDDVVVVSAHHLLIVEDTTPATEEEA